MYVAGLALLPALRGVQAGHRQSAAQRSACHGRRKLDTALAAGNRAAADARADLFSPPITNSLFWEDDDRDDDAASPGLHAMLLSAEQASPAQRLRRAVATCSALQGAQHLGGISTLPETQFQQAADVVDTLADLTLALHAHDTPGPSRTQQQGTTAPAAPRAGRRGVPQQAAPGAATTVGVTGRGVPAEGEWSDACTGRHAAPPRAVQPGKPVDYSPYNAQQFAKQWKRERERWQSEYAW